MSKFNLSYDRGTPRQVKCVYKITIGEYFYYGSTNDFIKRARYYEYNLRECTVLLNKKIKIVSKAHMEGVIQVIFSSDSMEEVKEMEHFFLQNKFDDPKSMNRTRSAYDNTGGTKNIRTFERQFT